VEDKFWIFCESPPGRAVSAKIIQDYANIELRIQMDAPPDELMQTFGLHASAVHLSPTNEFIRVAPPRKISPKVAVKTRGWPSDTTPLWVVWEYCLQLPGSGEDEARLEFSSTTDVSKYIDFLKKESNQ
jgi:hypothetical protein